MTLNTGLMFSSETDKWDTPADLVADLATVFDWDLDVCASRPNVCKRFNSKAEPVRWVWSGLCWMNPPYGRDIGKWVCDARRYPDSYQPFGTDDDAIVCLLPARTDTKWWQGNIRYASQVVFIRGRLKFGDATNSAPFPSAFVVFGEITDVQRAKLASYGWSVTP